MKKILFPTDFSKASVNAFIYALNLAKQTKAEIITLHVYALPLVDNVEMPVYLSEVYDSMEFTTFESFKGQIPFLRKIADENNLNDIPISSVLLNGDLVNTILKIVKDELVDYVVMGTKGASGIKEKFLGTATADVMTGTKATVLAVPENAVYKGIDRIAFTTLFKETDFKTLKKLLLLAKAFDAEVDCLHIKNSRIHVKEVVRADWELLFKNEKVTFHYIENENAEEAILGFLGQNQTDVLALLNHEHRFFEGLFHRSMAKKLVFHSKIPVLAFHED
jgi:nucleotide-binding universal stress UspA family protein